MSEEMIMIPGVSFSELNHLNAALKNDYISNIYNTGMVVLSRMRHLSGIKIIKGFISKQAIESKCLKSGELFNWYWKKFSFGLGIDVTWDNWDEMSARLVAKSLTSVKENLHVYIDTETKSVTVLRKMKNKKIFLDKRQIS